MTPGQRSYRSPVLARRFLYIVAALILVVLAAGIAWTLFQQRILQAVFVPSVAYVPPADRTAPDYATAAAWVARPGLADDPSHWTAPGFPRAADPKVAVFFVPPTTSLQRDRWNGPLDDHAANQRLRLFVASQASAFNGVGAVWAPRYRQATIGAFLTDRPDARKALAFAYGDVARAFAAFLAQVPADAPIILAGHSQGSLHLTRLLAEQIAGKAVAHRIVAAYLVGWPVSVTADLPAFGLPACAAPDQTGCALSWLSYAEPADASQFTGEYDRTTGFTGQPRKGTPILCTDPLTGTRDGAAPASANPGALVPDAGLAKADIVPGRVPARCAPPGLLLIGAPPEGFGRYVLPGNNYHVFDYALFWAAVRADAARRVAAWVRAHG